ncbi:hypothetical protein AAC387_Pa03g2045 [Persea americana]|eukprot:TRINITY_DN35824_c0_g1_i1.p1 TRINITY_DN35824_c0_g1~~TRINITY_DN35824_c0_g1_i1.p1  ORF type:complete len:100 (-),score=10.75 TRINITY_DN35824_c0_g1_i1:290-589(-)
MACSLLKANLVAAVADTISLFSIFTTRRGYSISSTSNAVVRGRSTGVVKAGEEVKKVSSDSNSWVPDPVTGYYRPANRASDVDVAELRQILLTQKLHQH